MSVMGLENLTLIQIGRIRIDLHDLHIVMVQRIKMPAEGPPWVEHCLTMYPWIRDFVKGRHTQKGFWALALPGQTRIFMRLLGANTWFLCEFQK